MAVEFYSSYLYDIYHPATFKKLVDRVAKKVVKLKKKLKFNAIAFSGSSGAALAYPVSALTKIPLIHVRKKGKTHGDDIEGGGHEIKRYIILDDFIDTGATVKRIYNQIKNECDYDDEVKCVAIVLYDKSNDHEESFNIKAKVTIPIILC